MDYYSLMDHYTIAGAIVTGTLLSLLFFAPVVILYMLGVFVAVGVYVGLSFIIGVGIAALVKRING